MRFQISVALMAVVLFGCDHQKQIHRISSLTGAESVYLTHDDNSNPVVAWTEKVDERLTLFFSVSKDDGETFTDKVGIPLSNDVATHAEGMPKVAFKKDGTIIAAYEKKAPTKENKYAGAIYYRLSNDKGKSWSDELFLHSDTTSGRSRSYFDIEQLPDGEVGASWLDIKLNNETGGRSVRFAKTTKDTGFGREILVDSSACQCCRIDVYADLAGRIHVAYRGLAKGKMGQSVRDMMLATSSDNGISFSSPTSISKDDWAIDGCPHTGPSLCSNKGGLYSFWYTEGNGTGIFYNFKRAGDGTFNTRQLISNAGRHPQISAVEDRFMMVWEENIGEGEKKFTNIYYQMNDGDQNRRESLTPSDSNAFVPVITQTENGFLVAFLMETKEGVGMYIARL